MFPPFVQELWKKENVRTAPVVDALDARAHARPDGQGGVATTVLSVLASGGFNMPRLSVEEHRRMTRMANDYAAKVAQPIIPAGSACSPMCRCPTSTAR